MECLLFLSMFEFCCQPELSTYALGTDILLVCDNLSRSALLVLEPGERRFEDEAGSIRGFS